MMKAIFLHGLGQKAFHWDGVRERLSLESEAWELTHLYRYPPSLFILANHLRRRLILEEEEVLLVGLSLGAMVALEIMRDPPESVKGLVLSGAHVDLRHHSGQKALQLMSGLGPKGLYVRLGLSRKNFHGFVKSFEDFCVLDVLSTIEVPTLILCGTRDAPARKNAMILHREIPSSTLRWVPGAGHLLNEHQEEFFAAAIEDFLKAQKKSP